MVVPVLVSFLVILGALVLYLYVLAPKLNVLKRADALMRQNMVSEAITELKKALDNNPSNSVAHYRLAEIYLKHRDTDNAVLHLDSIMKIGKFNYEVERTSVEKKLAHCYISRGDKEGAFQLYADVFAVYPGDPEALYHLAFISLGQEYFELAQKLFDRLVQVERHGFDILFGAGIANYQTQKTNEAAGFFKEALGINPYSDIGNLAMSLTLRRKRDYKTALNYAKMIVDHAKDPTALFIGSRLLGLLLVQAKRAVEGVRVLEDLLAHARKNEMTEEVSMILYDLGFSALNAEITDHAYEYWNQLYQHDKSYRDIQMLVTDLRKEMDADLRQNEGGDGTVIEHTRQWLEEAFPEDFLWNICGLKSDTRVNIRNVVATIRTPSDRGDEKGQESSPAAADAEERIAAFQKLDPERFKIVSNRVLAKMGYRVDEIMGTYRDSDGVDFLAHASTEKEKETILVWVRRWKDIRVGEIPIGNFDQAMHDFKVKEGVFITASELTPGGLSVAKKLPEIRIVDSQELGMLLSGLL